MFDEILSVTDISNIIKANLIKDKIKVSGEVSQPKLSNGHLYFSLKDNNSNLKAIIWKSKNINKNEILEGNKISVECYLDFYNGTSQVNLIIDKLIEHHGQGELYIKYQKIKDKLTNKGYFNKTKNLLPNVIKNILIITSNNGAALQDFLYTLNNNNAKINYTIANVNVQGIDCPKDICSTLENINNNYDIVIITRGGGSFEDLFGFSQPELIKSVYYFNQPVLSAIGHQIDNPLLDLVADISTPTPSLAAQFIIDHNKKYITNLDNIKNNCKNIIINNIKNELHNYNKLKQKLYYYSNELNNIKNNLKQTIINDINSLLLAYSKLSNKLIINPNINLIYNNISINNTHELEKVKDNIIKLRWGDKEYKIKII